MTEAGMADLAVLLPALVLVLFGIASILVGVVFRQHGPQMGAWLSAVGFIAAGSVAAVSIGDARRYDGFAGTVVADHLGHVLLLPCLAAGLMSILLSLRYLQRAPRGAGEFCGLLALATAGMAIMVQGQDLIVIFFGLELLSVPLYILAGYSRESASSREAAVKYLLSGGLASCVMVYGIALVYAYFGTTSLSLLAQGVAPGGAGGEAVAAASLPVLGIALVTVGLCFKAAVAPFHLWCPDVYQGAPTPVTAFFSVGPKVAALGALFRVLLVGFGGAASFWAWPVAILAALSMTLGNLGALRQTSLKRMLAYSGIAHAGYMLMALAAAGALRATGNPLWPRPAIVLAYYALAYAFMNTGAFAVATNLERDDRRDAPIARLRGFAKVHPAEATALIVFMVSLTGIPYTAGFLGKWLLLAQVVGVGASGSMPLLWLAVIAVLNSVVSAYYYLRPVALSFMEASSEADERTWAPSKGAAWVMVVAAAGVLGLAFYPTATLQAAQAVVEGLLD